MPCPKCGTREKLPGQSVCRQCLTAYQRERRARVRAALAASQNHADSAFHSHMQPTANPQPYVSPSESLRLQMIRLYNLERTRINNLKPHRD
jgi:hypothetical protein